MPDPVRVLVVDDHPLFRKGVVLSLQQDAALEVIGEADSGPEAVELTQSLQPELVLLDIRMGSSDEGLVAAASIVEACPDTQLVMLTVSAEEDDLLTAFKLGARGYVLKGVSAQQLRGIIHDVVNGKVYVSPNLAADILVDFSRPAPTDPLNALTTRERATLELVAEGLTNREVGERLYLSEKTVKHYMTQVLSKLQARNRVEAIAKLKR